MLKQVEPNVDFPKLEEKILEFWRKENIFQKSLDIRRDSPKFVFYEGPPTANAAPGLHHVLARVFKDIICRYKTMCGFYVKRRAGWDTHGLPVELQVEKQLGFKNKFEIEKYGIGKFNQKCKDSVWSYKKDWEELTHRIGFWLDLENPYITYENLYIEKVWSIFKKIDQKGLLYQGKKIVPYCPRCGTPLSSHELAQGYGEVVDPSIYVKFKVKNPTTHNLQPVTHFLVWTTTPWTLPGNTALAVGEKYKYVIVKSGEDNLILAKERLRELKTQYTPVKEVEGLELAGLEYEPLYPLVKGEKNAYRVYAASFVSLEEGTGIVHVASAFGEDDFNLYQEKDLPITNYLDSEGKFSQNINNLSLKGKFFKSADKFILDDLQKRKLLFRMDKIRHIYPFCWRCQTPLIYQALDSWFIKMTDVKAQLQQNNQKINWVPAYIKDGRFGQWLKELKDWAISRRRYWGTPLPIWLCGNCGQKTVIGSLDELEKLSADKISLERFDLHRPDIDKVQINCPNCQKKVNRVEDLIDVWFDSGAMPFASKEYPDFYPADYICEAVDQTRGWFYTLLAISTLQDLGTSYKNVISLGHILDDKGQKMSKSKGNIVDPISIINKFGVDSIRWYFFTINQPGDSIRFSQDDISKSQGRFRRILWNIFVFYATYVPDKIGTSSPKVTNILDSWILSKLNSVISKVTADLNSYQVVSAARILEGFLDIFSNWYLRRSRKRVDDAFWQTLRDTLITIVKLVSPFAPFISEKIYQNLKNIDDPESVHLCDWPEVQKNLIDAKLNNEMERVLDIVKKGHALRMEAEIKVRQPLDKMTVYGFKKLRKDLEKLILDELNIKKLKFDEKSTTGKKESLIKVWLDTRITSKLLEEGLVREIIRAIQNLRKKKELNPSETVPAVLEIPEKIKKILEKKQKLVEEETKTILSFNNLVKDESSKLEHKLGEIWIQIRD